MFCVWIYSRGSSTGVQCSCPVVYGKQYCKDHYIKVQTIQRLRIEELNEKTT